MNKFAVNGLILLATIFFSSLSQATLITNLTQAELDSADYSNAVDHLTKDLEGINYITHKGYDWAWVSPVNLEHFGSNTLYAPTVQKDWLFADSTLLNVLKSELTLTDFKNKDSGELIQASSYFNSLYDYVDEVDFNPEKLKSEWVDPAHTYAQFLAGHETFYVRLSGTLIPIPEPSTLLIFAFGIIALVRKRL